MEKLKAFDDDIVEDNDWGDTFRGICNYEGQNNLGKILMELRDKKNLTFVKNLLTLVLHIVKIKIS